MLFATVLNTLTRALPDPEEVLRKNEIDTTTGISLLKACREPASARWLKIIGY